MKKICVLFYLIIVLVCSWGDDFKYTFKNIPTFKMTVRANYRTYRNGEYTGLVSKEISSILDVKNVSDGVFSIVGQSYVLNQIIYSEKIIGLNIIDSEPTNYWMYADGIMSVSEDSFPYMRNIPYFQPRFNPDQIYSQIGSYVVNLKGDSFEQKFILPTTVIMKYDGISEVFGKKCDLFICSFTLQKSPVYSQLKDCNGKHNLRVFFDKNLGMPVYIEDNFQEVFTVVDNNELATIAHDGFYIHFFDPYRKLRVHLTAQEIQKQLDEDESVAENIKIKEEDDGIVLIVNNLQFSPNSDQIMGSEYKKIFALAKILSKQKDKMVLITGHTADAGTEEEQKSLSYARAKAVARELVDQRVNGKKLMIEGRGASEPVAPNDTPENMAKNRRVEIKILGR